MYQMIEQVLKVLSIYLRTSLQCTVGNYTVSKNSLNPERQEQSREIFNPIPSLLPNTGRYHRKHRPSILSKIGGYDSLFLVVLSWQSWARAQKVMIFHNSHKLGDISRENVDKHKKTDLPSLYYLLGLSCWVFHSLLPKSGS